MDTSRKYIKMCNVKEIQDLWIPDYGDFYNDNHDIRKTVGTLPEKEFVSERPLPLPFIWMPRQDQLQEILKESHTMGAMIQGLYWFYDPEHFCPEPDNENRICTCKQKGMERRTRFSTIEQLWLAVVMDEIYKKEWNGIEWLQKDAGRITPTPCKPLPTVTTTLRVLRADALRGGCVK